MSRPSDELRESGLEEENVGSIKASGTAEVNEDSALSESAPAENEEPSEELIESEPMPLSKSVEVPSFGPKISGGGGGGPKPPKPKGGPGPTTPNVPDNTGGPKVNITKGGGGQDDDLKIKKDDKTKEQKPQELKHDDLNIDVSGSNWLEVALKAALAVAKYIGSTKGLVKFGALKNKSNKELEEIYAKDKVGVEIFKRLWKGATLQLINPLTKDNREEFKKTWGKRLDDWNDRLKFLKEEGQSVKDGVGYVGGKIGEGIEKVGEGLDKLDEKMYKGYDALATKFKNFGEGAKETFNLKKKYEGIKESWAKNSEIKKAGKEMMEAFDKYVEANDAILNSAVEMKKNNLKAKELDEQRNNILQGRDENELNEEEQKELQEVEQKIQENIGEKEKLDETHASLVEDLQEAEHEYDEKTEMFDNMSMSEKYKEDSEKFEGIMKKAEDKYNKEQKSPGPSDSSREKPKDFKEFKDICKDDFKQKYRNEMEKATELAKQKAKERKEMEERRRVTATGSDDRRRMGLRGRRN